MPQPIEDDLFRQSTMTFGEHLEELRTCLFKSIYGLALGLAIGLYFGSDVVNFIQTPLSEALNTYYQKESIKRVQGELQRLKDSPRALPWTDVEIKDRVEKQNLLAEEVFIDQADLLQQLKAAYPGQFDPTRLPPQDATDKQKAAGGEDIPGMMRLFLWRPGKDDQRVRIKSLNAQEAFSVYIKASLLVGALIASPWIFYQIWSFVAAGLYPHERRYVHVFLPVSLGLFLFGAALAFFAVFRPVLNFLLGFNASLGIDPDPRINEWLSFVLFLPLGFGIGFQLPLVMLFMERIGIFTVGNYLAQWRISVLVIFVLAAILTPPDPYSMLLMAAPLTVLFFGGVLLCTMLPRKQSPFGDSGS